MPAAHPGFVFSQFLEGYMRGSQQSQLMRLQKASNLMQLASMRAKEIGDIPGISAEQRAAAWNEVNAHMDEAEKTMKGSDGVWSAISGLWKKKSGRKDTMEDPYQIPILKAIGIIPESQETKVPLEPGAWQGPEQAGAKEKAAPTEQPVQKDAAGVAYENKNIPSTLGGPPPEGPPLPPEMAEKQRLSGISQAVWGGQEPESFAPKPTDTTLPERGRVGAMTVTTQKPVAAPKGTVYPLDMKNEGLEMVTEYGGRTVPYFNGQPVSWNQWNELTGKIYEKNEASKLRREESAERLEEFSKQLRAQLEATQANKDKAAEAYVQREGPNYDRETYNEIRFGVRNTSPRTRTKKWQDANGVRWESIVDPKTGEEYPDARYQTPMTAEDWKTRVYQLSNPGMSWEDAEKARADNDMQDEQLKDSVRKAQLANARLAEESKQLANQIKKEGKTGGNVIKAYTKVMELAKAAAKQPSLNPDGSINPNGGQVDPDRALSIAKGILATEFGISWSEVEKAFGGDAPSPEQSVEAKGTAYLGSFGQGGKTNATETPGLGSVTYKPKTK